MEGCLQASQCIAPPGALLRFKMVGRAMSVAKLSRALAFPHPSRAEPAGLLAVGGDLQPERLLLAYRSGIFPWYDEPPILWFSPDPRMVLAPAELRVSRRLARTLRQGRFRLSLDRAFPQVIRACATAKRRQGCGTWINADMIRAYDALHAAGFAHSCEVWSQTGAQLLGGLYGVSLGRAFFAESMFHHARDASKIAFVTLLRQLGRWGFTLFDCQLPTAHLASLGARAIKRSVYLERLESAVAHTTRHGRWRFDGANRGRGS